MPYASEREGDTHEYNVHKYCNKHKVYWYEGPFFLGFPALLLGCKIRLFTLIGIRFMTFVPLVSLRWMIFVTFPLVPYFLTGRNVNIMLSIKLALRRWLLLWQTWLRHGRLRCRCHWGWSTRWCIWIIRIRCNILVTRMSNKWTWHQLKWMGKCIICTHALVWFNTWRVMGRVSEGGTGPPLRLAITDRCLWIWRWFGVRYWPNDTINNVRLPPVQMKHQT